MAWDKGDFLAAAIIIFLLVIGGIIGLYLLGILPGSNTNIINFQ